MLFETYGDRKNPAVLFFHAMGVTGASSSPVAERLQDQYFCILPTSTVYCPGQRYRSKADEVRQVEDFLRAQGVPFRLETKTFDMGQPLRSLDDAVRFFEIYSKDAPGTITRETVLSRLRETGACAFPYYLPQKKALGRFILDAKAIPEEFL